MMELLLKAQTLTPARQTWIKVSFRGGMDGLGKEKGKREPVELLCHAPFSPFFSLFFFYLVIW